MEDQDDSFHQGKSVREVGVEDDGEKADGDNEERCLPVLKHVIGIVDDEETLDLEGSEKGNARDTRLPSQNANPAYRYWYQLVFRNTT